MPDSKRFRKYTELEASTTRWALNSTPSAQMAKSVSRSSRQRPAIVGWCGTPPLSVNLDTTTVTDYERGRAIIIHIRKTDSRDLQSGVKRRIGGIEKFAMVRKDWNILLGDVSYARPIHAPARRRQAR